jgi:hypothetical protein
MVARLKKNLEKSPPAIPSTQAAQKIPSMIILPEKSKVTVRIAPGRGKSGRRYSASSAVGFALLVNSIEDQQHVL